ncbi:dihydroorotate dehydrogenase [Candidatus Neomarinimicrobiota bacterium]
MNEIRLNSNLTLKNPILTASGTFGFADEAPQLVDVERLGGVVTKSVTLEPREGHPPPRIAETSSGLLNGIGLANPGVEKFCNDKLPFLNQLDTAVFISIAGTTGQDYTDVLSKIEACNPNIAGYEINISCPNVERGGMEFGVDAAMTEDLTTRLRNLTKRFLMVKLSPNVTIIAEIAKAAEGAGADGLSAINTVVGMDVDPVNGKFKVGIGLCGLSGPAILPIALANVYKVARAVKIPIMGMGGIMHVEDVIRFIRVGATAVQIGTLNYRDPAIGVSLAQELELYMARNGIESLESIRGTAG